MQKMIDSKILLAEMLLTLKNDNISDKRKFQLKNQIQNLCKILNYQGKLSEKELESLKNIANKDFSKAEIKFSIPYRS